MSARAAALIESKPTITTSDAEITRRQAEARREAFRARCEARALLFKAGDLDWYDTDVLQTDAVAGGLVRAFGQDTIQGIIAEAFDEVFESTSKWKEKAEAAWNSEGWHETAREYHQRSDRKAGRQRESAETLRARRLLDDDITLERAWHELNNIKGCAADSTVEALMFSLRSRGVSSLKEPDARRRLSELSDEQLIEVGTRLRKLKPEIARAWTADEILILMQAHERPK